MIDSVEFQDDAGLPPEIQGQLRDDFKHANLHAESATDMDWRNELAERVRLALQDQGYFQELVDLTSGLIRAEAQGLHY